jgi:methyltransferase
MSAPSPPPVAALALFLAAIVVQRLAELRLSARNVARLRARGAVEHGRRHFPLLVALHVLWPLALAWEVMARGARPPAAWPAWIVLLLAAQVLRRAAIRALGERWSVRIWVIPGEPPVRRGPYRTLRHPNYLAVVLELAAGPLLFGAWRTALAASALNLVALAIRIPAEEKALGIRR